MTIAKDSQLYKHYREARGFHSAKASHAIAAGLVAQGKTSYWSGATDSRLMGQYTSNGEIVRYDWRSSELTFIDKPENMGLRVIGFADEIAKSDYAHLSGIDHKGWYTDSEDQSDKFRGVVFQLPSRDGCAVYLSGYQDLDSRDRPNHGGYLVALRPKDWNIGEKGADDYRHDSEAARQAARDADGLAESSSEEARDYSDSWRLGQEYADHIAESRGYRLERRKLMATLGAARRDMNRLAVKSPWVRELCQRICDDIADLKESARKAYDAAQKILSDNPYAVKDAFNDGAGSAVL